MLDLVALLGEVLTTHAITRAPLTLRRGQIGTVVMTYDGTAFEVEFCDAQGRTFALLPIPAGLEISSGCTMRPPPRRDRESLHCDADNSAISVKSPPFLTDEVEPHPFGSAPEF